MAVELKMPALSPTMEEGTLAKWLVKEGDTIEPGDIIAEIETDKATMEFETIDEGTVGKLLVDEGTENVAVGTVIADPGGRGGADVEASCVTRPEKEERPGRGRRGRARSERRRRSPETCESQTEIGPRHSARHQHGDRHRSRGLARRDGGRNAP